uniref:Proton-coupled zinc antiporter SLC30A8 n=1 Tax=Taeniopygia guttata TaxID=59729 RepID=H0ZQ04_TAEGU
MSSRISFADRTSLGAATVFLKYAVVRGVQKQGRLCLSPREVGWSLWISHHSQGQANSFCSSQKSPNDLLHISNFLECCMSSALERGQKQEQVEQGIVCSATSAFLLNVSDFTIQHSEVTGVVMCMTSVLSEILSLILHQTGHGHSHGAQAMSAPLEKPALSNASLQAAFVHTIGDLFQSISVLISALIIFFKPQYKIADPICTFVFSIFVLATTITILRDILTMLMEGTSKGFAYDAVKARILTVEKVESVHDLHLWSLTMNQTALSAHIATADSTDSQKILRDVTQALFEHYSFHSITIQIESGEDQKPDCVFCQEPRD